MKSKQLVLLIVVALALAAYLMSGKFKTEKPNPAQMQSAEQQPVHNHPPTTVLPTVTEVTLAVKTTEDKLLSPITLKVGEAKDLPGTEYQLSVKEFHSHWNYDGRPVNISFNESNPAIKVDVMSNGTVKYYQWAFKNMEFFGGGPTSRHMTGDEKDLLFTLLNYKGFKIPEENQSDHDGHDHGDGGS